MQNILGEITLKEKIKKQMKDELEKKPLARISKEIRRGTRNKIKLEKEAKKQKGVEKQETEQYINTINEKLLLLLESITPETIQKSNLASISKAFRSILGQRDAFMNEQSKEPDKSVNVNFNINDMSIEDVKKMLAERSQEE